MARNTVVGSEMVCDRYVEMQSYSSDKPKRSTFAERLQMDVDLERNLRSVLRMLPKPYIHPAKSPCVEPKVPSISPSHLATTRSGERRPQDGSRQDMNEQLGTEEHRMELRSAKWLLSLDISRCQLPDVNITFHQCPRLFLGEVNGCTLFEQLYTIFRP